jgi:hypothetical protein
MKTRSSAGVGQKIDLDFDVDTLRIIDPGLPDGDSSTHDNVSAASSNIMNSIKTRSTMHSEADEEVGNIKADVKNAKLQKLLGKIN